MFTFKRYFFVLHWKKLRNQLRVTGKENITTVFLHVLVCLKNSNMKKKFEWTKNWNLKREKKNGQKEKKKSNDDLESHVNLFLFETNRGFFFLQIVWIVCMHFYKKEKNCCKTRKICDLFFFPLLFFFYFCREIVVHVPWKRQPRTKIVFFIKQHFCIFIWTVFMVL